MSNTKRKRAVVLALIAFFCTAAVTYVAVDWKRFGGGFLAFLKGGNGDAVLASTSGSSGSRAARMAAGDTTPANSPTLPQVASAGSRKHAHGVVGANGGKSEDDLFKYGDPAAGGIPPGSFIVAQNDTPAGGAGAPADPGTGVPSDGGGAGVTSPAPAPAGTGGGLGDTGLGGAGKTPATPPAGSPPTGSPPADPPPVGPPSQSGTTDDPGTPPPPSLPPVSSVPESSSLAMMGLGALFLAAAAAHKRRQG